VLSLFSFSWVTHPYVRFHCKIIYVYNMEITDEIYLALGGIFSGQTGKENFTQQVIMSSINTRLNFEVCFYQVGRTTQSSYWSTIQSAPPTSPRVTQCLSLLYSMPAHTRHCTHHNQLIYRLEPSQHSCLTMSIACIISKFLW
jgi:hypothetical protein